MINAEFVKDEHELCFWLRATHNGYGFSTIKINSKADAQKLIEALQKGIEDNFCEHGFHISCPEGCN